MLNKQHIITAAGRLDARFSCRCQLLIWMFPFYLGIVSAIAQTTHYNLTDFQHEREEITQGLSYHYYFLDTIVSDNPLRIFVLEADLNHIKLELGLALDQVIGQETVSSMVLRKGAIAGVNGGFSFSNNPWNIFHGDPKDLLIRDGIILSEPFKTRSSFGWINSGNQQIPVLVQWNWEGFAIHRNSQIPIHGLNRKRMNGENIYYSNDFHQTTLTKAGTLELVLDRENRIIDILREGSSPIPQNGKILSVDSIFSTQISIWKPGDTLQIQNNLEAEYWFGDKKILDTDLLNFHTAGPILMLGGKAVKRQEIEQIPEAFVTTRHPRTGIGISRDREKIWLLVVDGRQPNVSVGMSLPEMSSFLEQLGAWEAYNLDGGGSTTMVLKEEVLNSPSDGRERRRCDALLLHIKKEN